MELSAESGEVHKSIVELRSRWKVTGYRDKQSKELWLFKKNMAAFSLRGHSQLPDLVYFTLQYLARDAKGLPASDDAVTLKNVEDTIIPYLQKQGLGLCVGQVFKAGIKDYLFYVSNAQSFLESVNTFDYALEGLQVHLEQIFDPYWRVFEDFPGGN